MGNSFLCPQCNGHLKVGDSLVFATRARDHKAGLILLSPELGDYKVITHPSFDLEVGDYVDFFCPLCNVSLSSDKTKNLAKIIMIDEDLKESEILFSKISGEHCTYRIFAGKDVDKFGKNSDTYY